MSTCAFRPEQHPRAAGGTVAGGRFVTTVRPESGVRLDLREPPGLSPTPQEIEFSEVLGRHARGLISEHEAWTKAKSLVLDEMGPAIAAAQADAVRQATQAARDVTGALGKANPVDHLVAMSGWRHPSDPTVEGSSQILRDRLHQAQLEYPSEWTAETVDDVVDVLLANGFVNRKATAA